MIQTNRFELFRLFVVICSCFNTVWTLFEYADKTVLVNASGVVLQFYHIKTRHGFISNHSKCLSGVYQRTHLNFKTIQSQNFNLDEN